MNREEGLLVDGYILIFWDGVSIHPVTTKIQESFLTQLPERKETAQGFTVRPMVTLKQLQN